MGNFENELKDMFDGVEFKPSERVWAGVESALAQDKKKGIFFMWQTYGIAAAITLFITAGVMFNNGYFSNQQDPSKGAQQLTQKSSEELSTDSLRNKDGLNNQQFAKEGYNQDEEKVQDQPIQSTDSKQLLAKNVGEDEKGEKLSDLSFDSQKLSAESLGVTAVAQEDIHAEEVLLDNDVLIGLSQAEPKPYRHSLAAVRAKWLNSLGVDESALIDMISLTEEKQANTFVAERMVNGRLGNNNFNISSPENGQPLNARAEDAQFAAMSDISNSQEETLGSVSGGVGFSWELSNRLQLNTSIRYSELRVKSSSNAYSIENGESYPIYLPLGYDPDNVNFIGSYNLTNTMQGLSFQPTFSYKVAQFGKFDLSVNGGIGFDYFFAYRVKGDLNFLSVKRANLNDSDFIRKFNISGISGLGLNYRLNDQFGIGADFSYRYFVPTNGMSNRRQSSVLGFGLGVNYFLNGKN